MSNRDQYGFKTSAASVRPTGIPVTPGNMIKRPSSSLHETLSGAQNTPQNPSTASQSGRPVSFSRRPASSIERADPFESAARLRGASSQGAAPTAAKPKKRYFSKIVQKTADFVYRHAKGIMILVGAAAVFAWNHERVDRLNDQRARLNNEPLATLTPTTEYDKAVEYARNLVPSPSAQMKNGINTAVQRRMKNGAMSAITGGADIDTWSTKDGSRPDKSYIVTGQFAGTTGPGLGNTLIYGGDNLEKKTYDTQTINTEDQPRILEVVNLNERVSDLPQAAYSTSPTQARKAPPKRTSAKRTTSPTAARIMAQKGQQK